MRNLSAGAILGAVLVAIVAIACSSENDDGGSGQAASAATDSYDVTIQAPSVGSLPACTAALAGQTAFVASPPGLYSCQLDHWFAIPCTKLLGGAVAYASTTKTLWACSAGVWTQVALPAGPPGPQGDAGASGENALVIQTPFAADAGSVAENGACPFGGTEIDTGTNDGKGGFVPGSETTTYVCSSAASEKDLPLGSACAFAANCASGVCSAGACCTAACPSSPLNGCAATGCDATGACLYPSCANGFACQPGTDTCATTCESSSQCASGGSCNTTIDGGACVAPSGMGPCSENDDCTSGSCLGGECCATTCPASGTNGCSASACDSAGACVYPTCTGVYGCAPGSASCVTSCTVDSECATGHYCKQADAGAGANTCVPSATTGKCTENAQCRSGQCLGGECCSQVCGTTGACAAAACNSAGRCVLQTAEVGDSCGAAATCSGDQLTQAVCTSLAVCSSPETTTCPNNLDCAPGNVGYCLSACASNADCQAGTVCNFGSCVATIEPAGGPCESNSACASNNCEGYQQFNGAELACCASPEPCPPAPDPQCQGSGFDSAIAICAPGTGACNYTFEPTGCYACQGSKVYNGSCAVDGTCASSNLAVDCSPQTCASVNGAPPYCTAPDTCLTDAQCAPGHHCMNIYDNPPQECVQPVPGLCDCR